jgi:hypothetical protein
MSVSCGIEVTPPPSPELPPMMQSDTPLNVGLLGEVQLARGSITKPQASSLPLGVNLTFTPVLISARPGIHCTTERSR